MTARIGSVLRFWAICVLLLATPVVAQEISREQELGALRLQINRLQGDLARLGHERRSLEAELSRIEIELELQQIRVREAQSQRGQAAEVLTELEREVVVLEKQLEASQDELRGVLTRLYRVGDQGYLRLFLSLDSGQEVLNGVRQLRYLARRDAVALRQYVKIHDALADRREEARLQAEEIQQWLSREQNRRQELERVRARQATVLARIKTEHRLATARANVLVERERKLGELISMLTGQLDSMPAGAPITRYRGVLDWPVAGRVIRGFGPRLDPRYGTRVPHNGLQLTTASLDQVRSIYGGHVLLAAPLEGYGLTAIVLHPGRIFSLYAGLAELKVAKDDVLSLGQVVGVVTGQFYFEIRVENRPENPVDWLR
jgi:septal ring factor EnvC (AmiA/AmiB activator)